MKKCVYWGKELTGRQTKYCSKECKNKDFNENTNISQSRAVVACKFHKLEVASSNLASATL